MKGKRLAYGNNFLCCNHLHLLTSGNWVYFITFLPPTHHPFAGKKILAFAFGSQEIKERQVIHEVSLQQKLPPAIWGN